MVLERWGAAAGAAAPYAAMAMAECLDVGLSTLAKAAISGGLSHFIFVLYSNVLATLIFSICYFLRHRGNSPPVTFPLLCRFFFLGLIGTTIMQNCVFTGISYSSPMLGSAIGNLSPGFTFSIAVLLRIETINIRSLNGLAKIIGTLICISGALIIVLWKGPKLTVVHFNNDQLALPRMHLLNSLRTENWIIGGLFFGSATLSISLWNNLQAATVERYPAEMTIVTFNSLFATIQCAFICFIIERDPDAWKLMPDIKLASIVYSAIFGSVVTPIIQTWCLHKRGPVFVAMFKPFSIAVAAFMSFAFLGDPLYFGSVIGAVLIIIGFYSVIWGKSIETNKKICKDNSSGASSPQNPLLPCRHA